tara:strand:+ start:30 stop:758 length:729 start_codon:yes stop_codon:yes gene_type:complete
MIICEIGLNHMGDIKYANEYIDKIIKSKAEGVLFHIREKSFYEINPKLLLPDKFYVQASKKIKKHKIKFGITLADPDKIEFCKKIDVDFYKIFSRDILDKKIIDKIKSTKKKTYVSTGMSNLSEIKKFIKLINYNKQFTLIHTQLDNDIEKVNLKAILLLKEKFKMNVGYGNHAKNIFSIFVSIAYQPSDYLFYVKGSKIKKHPDEPHSISLNNLKDFIKNIKDLEKAVGNKTKIKMNANIK